jgi:hypothetical protein
VLAARARTSGKNAAVRAQPLEVLMIEARGLVKYYRSMPITVARLSACNSSVEEAFFQLTDGAADYSGSL